MELIKNAAAGTLESGDIMIEISPGQSKLTVDLKSPVERMFGEQIRTAIEAAAIECGVHSGEIRAIDMGALDCVIRARVITAIYRAAGRDDFQFK